MARRTARDTYQIGELAALGGVTPDTLRYYERLGLLPEASRMRAASACISDPPLAACGSSSRRRPSA